MDDRDRIFRRCAWRLIPLVLVLYFVNYLDRVNVAFASLTMNRDLGLTASQYGLGAGILFFGYTCFQIPANLILERVGARRWIFLILLIWGALSAANSLIQGPISLYILRFALGAAEAGLYPGIIFYLTLWFPPAYRARMAANFLIGLPLAFVIGSPLSGLLLQLDGVASLHGWQWLFLLEGLPACLLAFVILKLLPDTPAHAPWLSDQEKQTIAASLSGQAPTEHPELSRALLDPRVIVLGLVYLADQAAASGSRFWLPQIMQSMGYANFSITVIVALPFVVGIGAMFLWGRSSDLMNERVWHVALPLLLTAACFVIASFAPFDLVAVVSYLLSMIWPLMFLGPFWGLNSSFLGGRAAAGAIALVSTFGSLGAFIGPSVVGVLKDATGGYGAGMTTIALALMLSAAAVVSMGRSIRSRAAVAEQKT